VTDGPADPLIASLTRAVAAAPDDLALRAHLAALLIDNDRHSEAISHVGVLLAADPDYPGAAIMMQRALGVRPPSPATTPFEHGADTPQAAHSAVDWNAFESEMSDVVPPAFVAGDDSPTEGPPTTMFDIERVALRLDDVGGLADVKEQLELSFLAPLKRPELQQLFGKRLQGGMILYGPPGCGKSFLAKALAGELGANFLSLQLHEILDMWVGSSERNMHNLFLAARASRPCLLFIDELDAIGQKRTSINSSAMRTTVNQLLAELDGVTSDNEGVYVIAATNHPWDVDSALRRPGRFDRMMLVPPPDRSARQAIFETHLRERPVERIDTSKLAKLTGDFSGADIALACEAAVEMVLRDSLRSGTVRRISMDDVESAITTVRPSTRPWFDAARNVVQFANEAGTYDALRDYMKAHRLL
jgi:SpoVK/Ycf46/Vps4 family AAA+-type ATPase